MGFIPETIINKMKKDARQTLHEFWLFCQQDKFHRALAFCYINHQYSMMNVLLVGGCPSMSNDG